MKSFEPILDFWFSDVNDAILIRDSATVKKWFVKDKAFDREVREKFETDVKKAQQGEYRDWEGSPRGRLGLVILFDQFTRNIYRNSPCMYEADPLALDLSLRTVKEGKDKELQFIERAFLYMPFMHSEDLKVQRMSVKCFKNLVEETKSKNPQNTSYYEGTYDYAQKHFEIVERFGRFPHRNDILKRSSTPEEKEFLTQPGSSF